MMSFYQWYDFKWIMAILIQSNANFCILTQLIFGIMTPKQVPPLCFKLVKAQLGTFGTRSDLHHECESGDNMN